MHFPTVLCEGGCFRENCALTACSNQIICWLECTWGQRFSDSASISLNILQRAHISSFGIHSLTSSIHSPCKLLNTVIFCSQSTVRKSSDHWAQFSLGRHVDQLALGLDTQVFHCCKSGNNSQPNTHHNGTGNIQSSRYGCMTLRCVCQQD